MKKWRQRLKVMEKLASAPAPASTAAAADAKDEEKYVVAAADEGEPLLPVGLIDVLSKDLDMGLNLTDEDVEREMMHTGAQQTDFDLFGDSDNSSDSSAQTGAAGSAKPTVTVSGSLSALGRDFLDLDEAEMKELNLKMMNGMNLDEFDSIMRKLGIGAGAGAGAGASAAAPTTAAAAAPATAASTSAASTASSAAKK
jgi:hypothetical protein